ncbi:ribonuclease domain-containing protein [Stenomitos frigidus]|uniref:Guanyl-specific ribonuclease Sa n=1 Tax=Stenomitos frigidus ULC18 TaxID=2107698 RepID=A0A2T1E8J4_9CYAN|nr:ribonuclease domain-containing protein [Stenomitos frigidus]PSB29038.1 guanyl-specific ribonuclease Sa [Stenomitos frigidus ULC18]
MTSNPLIKRLLQFVSLFLTVLTLTSLVSTFHVQAQPDLDLRNHAETAIVARATVTIPAVRANQLPPEARTTIQLIRQGGPFPYPKDGTVFRNRERLLPQAAIGYYREYTVKTPGRRDRGARRIITGQQGEIYYTGDHYASFVRVQ